MNVKPTDSVIFLEEADQSNPSYSILMSVPFHENHLLGFRTEDWIIQGLKHEMGRWFL